MVQKCLEIIFTSSQFTYSGTLSGDDVGTTEAQWCPRDESLVCQSLSVSDSSVTLAGRTSLMCLRVLWVTSILGWHKLSVLHSIVYTLQNKELFILRGSCVCVYIYNFFKCLCCCIFALKRKTEEQMEKKLVKFLCSHGHALDLRQVRVLPRCGMTRCEGHLQPIFVLVSFLVHHCGDAACDTYSPELGLLTLSDGMLDFFIFKNNPYAQTILASSQTTKSKLFLAKCELCRVWLKNVYFQCFISKSNFGW